MVVIKNPQQSGALHLTQKVDYGILLLTAIAENKEESPSIKKIAEETKVSLSFLQKIAGLLRQAGIISSSRGKLGGYKLAKQPEEITMRDIIEALEGEIAVSPCLATKKSKDCKHSSYCRIKKGLQIINQEINSYLATKKLSFFIS